MTTLPSQTQILIIGAGPAGSAAARLLAEQGKQVVMIDQHHIGRDKICGDGLIPDAHKALARLGLLDAVLARAQRVEHVRCVGRYSHVDIKGELAVLPRRILDEMLVKHAITGGAQFFGGIRFKQALEDDGRVIGAVLQQGEHEIEIKADWVLLATGATPKALQAANMCERHTPSGVALRAYVYAPTMVERITEMEFVCSVHCRHGYGWIFPEPDGVFNIGVCFINSYNLHDGKGKRNTEANLRQIFDAFVAEYPLAKALLQEGELISGIKGAPMRCTLQGSRWSRAGLMVIGEASGTTYSCTGEGIGKAMETALLAADAIINAHSDEDETKTRARYEAGLLALKPKYELYEKANRIHAYPWLADIVIWFANRNEKLRTRMSGILRETSNPGNPFSLKGVRRVLFG